MAPDRVRASIAVDRLNREQQRTKLAAQVSDSKNAVLELDETREKLCVWHWPVKDDGERVAPSDLVTYRKSHQFRGPRCLCLLLDEHDPSNHYEAAIVKVSRGPNAGEYLACCALSKCGYVVFIEKLHGSIGLPIKCYPRRRPDEARPLDVVFVDGNDIELADVIQRRQPRRNDTHTTFEKLMKLDSFTRPGLTQGEFRRFLTRCNCCELVMTRRMFERHECVGREGKGDPEIIDLTAGDV
ncbi:hypothetical protein C8R48DRAFT_768991 [Suillus tomentosus]|nr:hypothetical protein C8R48DRAFT_768991 [Suillus tomentosus]